jgi:ABC-type sugar transport system permease subunit
LAPALVFVVGVVAYPIGLEAYLSLTDASPGQDGSFTGLANYGYLIVGLLSTDLGESGPTFAAVLVGVAPIALSCAFFADSFAEGLGTGIIE